MSRHQTFVAIESAMSKRLIASWRQDSADLWPKVQAALDKGEFGRARSLVSDIDLSSAGKRNAEWMKYLLLAAAKFGANNATDGRTVVGLNGHTALLDRVVSTFINWLYHQANNDVTTSVLQSIANAEVARSVKSDGPRTLYVRRNVLNSKEIVEWAKAQGFETTLPDMHVTLAYSKTEVEWPTPVRDRMEVAGGKRQIKQFGEAFVLRIADGKLSDRWKALCEHGCHWKFPSFQPHVTISYGVPSKPLDEIEPFEGVIELGPEIFEPVKENWQDTLVEKAGPGEYVKGFTSFAGEGDEKLRLASSLHTSRLATWGFTAEADVRGYEKYRLWAQDDARTSEFCSRVAADREFDVALARTAVNRALSVEDLAELKLVAAFPPMDKESIDEMEGWSDEQLIDAGYIIPPFHPYCRTMLVKVSTGETVDPGDLPDAEDEELADELVDPQQFIEVGMDDPADEDVAEWNAMWSLSPVTVLARVSGFDPQDLLTGDWENVIDRVGTRWSLGSSGLMGAGTLEVNAAFDTADRLFEQNFAEFDGVGIGTAAAGVREIMRGQMALAANMSARELVISATPATVYPLVRAGYLPDVSTWDTIRTAAIARMADDLNGLSYDQRSLVSELLENPNPKALTALAAMPIMIKGKQVAELVLVDASFTARLNMADADATERFAEVFA